MRFVGLIFSLIIITSAAGAAETQVLASTERKLGEIVQQFSSPYIRNPMFLCYHMGRLQSFADILAIQVHQLATRATSNPEKQALTIARGQQLHLKADRLLQGRTYDCDPAFPKSKRGKMESDDDVVYQIRAARPYLRGLSGEDLVISCFHTGRLSMLSGRLNEMLRQGYGGSKTEALQALLGDAAKDVKARSKKCKAQSIY